MVARRFTERPSLSDYLRPILKGLRRTRGVKAQQMARDLATSPRAYNYFEAGYGQLNVNRVHRFASLLDADPYAILAAVEIRSPEFAFRCSQNKLMTVFMMALQDFDEKAQDTIVHLDPLTLMEAFSEMFEQLAAKAKEQEEIARRSLGKKS